MEAFCHAAPFGHLLTTLQAGNGSAQGDLLQDADVQREPLKEPAKRWRNWWRSNAHGFRSCSICGRRVAVTPSEVYSGHCRVWPSKDTAESHATTVEHPRTTYLGAFPEGERP